MEAPGWKMRILVDRITCQGFAAPQAGTPSLIRLYDGLSSDQDEKGSIYSLSDQVLPLRVSTLVNIWNPKGKLQCLHD